MLRSSTGEEVYTERLAGVSTSSSPIATPDGRVYLASAGKSYVVKAGPKLEILATNDLGDGSPASPGGRGRQAVPQGPQVAVLHRNEGITSNSRTSPVRYAIAFAFLIAPSHIDHRRGLASRSPPSSSEGEAGLRRAVGRRRRSCDWARFHQRQRPRRVPFDRPGQDLGAPRSNDAKGRTETPGCFQIDPTGKTKRLLMRDRVRRARSRSGRRTSPSGGRSTRPAFTSIGASADWSDPDLKFLLALKHESGGLLLRSRDGGKTFDEVGKGYGPAWVFDADTAVVHAREEQGASRRADSCARPTAGRLSSRSASTCRCRSRGCTAAPCTGSRTARSSSRPTRGRTWAEVCATSRTAGSARCSGRMRSTCSS